jgi:mannose-6-phosphate isomerase-like protein (cupin superfamily)
MKVKLDNTGGEVIKNNDTYILEDNTYLEHMIFSRTLLRGGKSTRGHLHKNEEEIYIFTHGEAFMQIGEEFHHAKSNDVFLIKAGQFHRVFNKSESQTCAFTCIFEKYDREDDNAIYKEL